MLAIRLSDDLEQRLAELAARTGRTKTYYARRAIEEYIDDLEDHALAAEAMADYDPKRNRPLDDVMRDLGLED
jgi:RHH-type rel operon transcriptional repressor/antitoxin RelB